MLGNAGSSLLQYVRGLANEGSSDEQLLADYLARRSDDAFAALLGRHGPMVLNVCRRILHDAHAAEDVFQATFLILANRAGAIRRRASLAGFLHGVAYRLAVRAKKRRLQSLPPAACDRSAAPADGLAWKEMLGILDHELGQLSDRFRSPLVLCYLEGRTQDEAARQLGWSLNTLRRRLAQGRRLLEARLRGRGVTLSAALAGLLAASAIAVPGPLHAATLAAGAKAVGGWAGGPAILSSLRKGITFMLSSCGKKTAALVGVAALGAAVCLAYCWAAHEDQPPAANAPPVVEADKGDSVPAQGTVRLGTAMYRHGDRIASMAVSADGKLAVTASAAGPYSPTYGKMFRCAYVFDLIDGRRLYSPANETGREIEAVGLSPDGKTLAGKDDKVLYFWDAATGKELRKLDYTSPSGGGRSPTDWITFSPDAQRVAVTLMGDAVQLIDVETCKAIRTFSPGGAASACVFSPDGKLLATAGYEQEMGVYYAHLWEVGTGKELRRIPAGSFPGPANGGKRTLAFAADGATLAGGGWGDARLRLWETATGKELTAFPKVGEDVRSVAFAPDGKTVAAAADNVYLYDPTTGKERLRIERRARGLAFSRDGSVLTGAVGGAIYRWDAVSGRQLTPAAAQDSAVEQILVSADGRSLFTTDQDGGLYLWDTAGKKSPRRIAGGVEQGVVASADRRFLGWTVPADYGNTRIRLYDVEADRIIDPEVSSSTGYKMIAGKATVAAFLPDGKSLLTFEAGGPPTYRLWDVETWKELRSFAVEPPKLIATQPSNAPAERGGAPVHLWNVATGKAGQNLAEPLNLLEVPDEAGTGDVSFLGGPPLPVYTIRQEALSPDGKTLAVGPNWADSFSKRRMKSMDGRAFSPDGRMLVDWAENPLGRSRLDHVCVWDTATGRAVATLTAGSRPGASNAAFSPDGRTLATASADGVVRLWEVATWKVRGEFRGHRDRVTALAFGPDGRLFTGGLDTTVLGWEIRPPRGEAKGTLAEAWEALADTEAKAGFVAQGQFLAKPDQAVEWLAARVIPVRSPDPARVKSLIADLDSDAFAVRERASTELREQGPVVAAALREAMAKPSSAEARRRVEGLLREMENGGIAPGELRALRAVETLEWLATPAARARLLELAKGTPEARLTLAAGEACNRLESRK